MKIKPKHDFILVEPLEEPKERTSAGGIVLPESSQERNLRGTVLEVGDGRWNSYHARHHGSCVEPGSVVLFNEFAGVDVTVDGRSVKLIREMDVIAEFVT